MQTDGKCSLFITFLKNLNFLFYCLMPLYAVFMWFYQLLSFYYDNGNLAYVSPIVDPLTDLQLESVVFSISEAKAIQTLCSW